MRIFLIVVISFFSVSFYGMNDTISIIRHTEKDAVFPKDLKVVYRGIRNNLSIEVPSCKSFKVSGNGLTLDSKNVYNLNPGAGMETIVTIDIVLHNNKKITENHKFKIKNLSNLGGWLNQMEVAYNTVSINKNSLKEATISLKCIDKNLDFNLKVKHFIIGLPDNKKLEVYGNKITQEVFNKIRVRSGETITIYDFHFDYLKTNHSVLFCKIPTMILIVN